jgi:hypothetical protein
LNLNDETSLEIVRGFIYESKGIVNASYFDGVLEIYNAKDFQLGTQRERSGSSFKYVETIQDGARNTSSVKESRGLKPIDKDYFATVNNGYMKIADRMVDEEAKKARYTIKAYHGSKNVFRAFDKSKKANGEIIVETNDMEKGKHGVNNVLVFAKGFYENYKIRALFV